MKKLLLITATALLFLNTNAQKIISTAGKHFYGSDCSLNWTIGEPVINI